MIIATIVTSAKTLFKHHNKSIDVFLQYTDPRKRNYFCCNCDTNLLAVWCIILIACHDVDQNIHHFVVCLYNMHVSLKLDNQFWSISIVQYENLISWSCWFNFYKQQTSYLSQGTTITIYFDHQKQFTRAIINAKKLNTEICNAIGVVL